MRLFSVFCAILYLHAGDSIPNHDLEYPHLRRRENIDSGQGSNIPLTAVNNPIGVSNDFSSQSQNVLANSATTYRRTEESHGNAENISPKYVKPYKNILPNQSQLLQNINTQEIPQTTYEYNNRQLKQPVNQEQDRKLEVQGVTLEQMKSLYNTYPNHQPVQKQSGKPLSYTNSYQGLNKASNIYSESNISTKKSSYQNPSAENMYRTNQASFYRLNTEQIPGVTQDNYNKGNIVDIKRVADLYSSLQPTKKYTVIHTDGKVEHFDHLDHVISKFPKYTILQSADIKNYIDNSKIPLNNTAFQPTKVTNISPGVVQTVNNLVTTDPTQNRHQDSVLAGQNNPQPPLDSSRLPLGILTPDEINISSKLSAPSNIQDNNSTTENLLSTNSTGTLLSKNALESSTKADPGNVTNAKGLENVIAPISTEILPEANLQNATQTLTIEDTGSVTVTNTPKQQDLENLSNVRNATNSDKTNVLNDTLAFVDDSINITNQTNASLTGYNDVITTNITSTESTEIIKENTWFQADEQFWERLIKKNNQNVILFFLPPEPRTEKITIIKYPNGTVVQEATITIVDECGVPVSKTLRETRVNCTNGT